MPTKSLRSNGVVALTLFGSLLFGNACGSTQSSSTTTDGRESALAEFATAADVVCVRASQRFVTLPDPDGPGNGAKPIGVGGFMHDMADDLRAIDAPPSIEDHWMAGLALLDQAADKLIESEAAAAAGDLARAGAAQGGALWSLEAEAQEHFAAMKAPFRACFVE